MIALLIGAALSHATAPSHSVEPVESIAARDGQVLASQIAEVPAGRDAVIATLPDGAGEVAWSEVARTDLIRNRYPGARYRLRHDGPVRILREAAVEADPEAACTGATASIPAGAYLTTGDVGPAHCQREAAGGWLGYDVAARSYFARRPIPAGTYLGRLSVSPFRSVAEGSRLVYRTTEGPVAVEREVVALQSGIDGRAVFVRTEEGKVLAAPLTLAEESE